MVAQRIANQFGLDVEEVKGVMWAFNTGVSVRGGTWPGNGLQTEHFKVVFEGVTEDGEKSARARFLETCCDWTAVMKKMLGATRDYGCLEDIEDNCEEEVKDWLSSYYVLGLLSCGLFLPGTSGRYFLLVLLRTYFNWDEATGGPRTLLEVFNTAKATNDHIQGKIHASLVPLVEVWFVEDKELEERRKRMVVSLISGQQNIRATFVLEKKRLNRNLK